MVAEDGTVLKQLRFELTATSLTGFACRHLDDDCAVALEATTNTWAVVDILSRYCPRIVVGNPMRTKAIASAKIKTDKVDAEVLAQLLRLDYLPPVWQPDAATRAGRAAEWVWPGYDLGVCLRTGSGCGMAEWGSAVVGMVPGGKGAAVGAKAAGRAVRHHTIPKAVQAMAGPSSTVADQGK